MKLLPSNQKWTLCGDIIQVGVRARHLLKPTLLVYLLFPKPSRKVETVRVVIFTSVVSSILFSFFTLFSSYSFLLFPSHYLEHLSHSLFIFSFLPIFLFHPKWVDVHIFKNVIILLLKGMWTSFFVIICNPFSYTI